MNPKILRRIIIVLLSAAVLTGSGGGIVRDVLAKRKPLVLKNEVYAVWAVVTGLVIGFGIAVSDISLYILFVSTTILRVISYLYKWRLPFRTLTASEKAA